MSTWECDFPTGARIYTAGATPTLLRDFHDHDNGVDLFDEVVIPRRPKRQARRKNARVHGSFKRGPRLDDDGTVIIFVKVEGVDWPAVETKVAAILDDFDANEDMFVEVELSGVTHRWFTDAPVDVIPGAITKTDRLLNRQDYELRFLVQPFPVVTIGA